MFSGLILKTSWLIRSRKLVHRQLDYSRYLKAILVLHALILTIKERVADCYDIKLIYCCVCISGRTFRLALVNGEHNIMFVVLH